MKFWNCLEFVVKMYLQKITNGIAKLKLIFEITYSEGYLFDIQKYDLKMLHRIAISESSKSYLLKEVDEINKEFFLNQLKSSCQFIRENIFEINPNFTCPNSLANTLLETAHDHQFFLNIYPNSQKIEVGQNTTSMYWHI